MPIPTLLLISALVALGAAGCNVLGPAAYIVHGPPRTPAVFELPDAPTVVFVDDRQNAIPRNSVILRRLIADTASTELMQHAGVTTTIRPQDALATARQQDRYQTVMPLDAIGEAVGADQVIYVEMLAFRDSPDGYTPRPTAVCRIKVIDAANRVRLFPPEGSPEEWWPLTVDGGAVSPDLYTDSASRLMVYEQLAATTGDRIAKLFYSHETKELGGQLNPR